MRTAQRIRISASLLIACVTVTHVASASADAHKNYPAVPSGYTGLVRAFGQPCNADTYRNSTTWKASDDGKQYPIRYHARLGGAISTALHDVIYHLGTQGHTGEIRSGIYGYACRRKRGHDSEWSVHAWGVAFDVSTRYEHFRHDHCHVVSGDAGAIWTAHRWRWGLAWGDCMHMQYATGY